MLIATPQGGTGRLRKQTVLMFATREKKGRTSVGVGIIMRNAWKTF